MGQWATSQQGTGKAIIGGPLGHMQGHAQSPKDIFAESQQS